MEYSWTIFPKYVKVLNEYLTHFMASEKYKKRDKDGLYLLLNGFTTLTHIFKILLNHNLNVDQAIESTEKAIYYYTEFIEQMDVNRIHDLNVSSNNASLFVYKKTIHHLLPEPINKHPVIQNIDYLLLIYRSVMDHLLVNTVAHADDTMPLNLINVAIELCRDNSDESCFKRELQTIIRFIEHFPPGKNYYEHIYLFLKKYKHSEYKHSELAFDDLIQKKIDIKYADKLKESADSYIKWLMIRPE
jgi:hypothetical protein